MNEQIEIAENGIAKHLVYRDNEVVGYYRCTEDVSWERHADYVVISLQDYNAGEPVGFISCTGWSPAGVPEYRVRQLDEDSLTLLPATYSTRPQAAKALL